MIGACPECNGKLSSAAPSCPHCGYTQQTPPQQQPQQQINVNLGYWDGCVDAVFGGAWLAVLGVIALAFVAWLLLSRTHC